MLAVYLVWCFCETREVTFYGSLCKFCKHFYLKVLHLNNQLEMLIYETAFIVIYVIYLIVALSGQAIHSRLLGNYAIAESMEASEQFKEKQANE